MDRNYDDRYARPIRPKRSLFDRASMPGLLAAVITIAWLWNYLIYISHTGSYVLPSLATSAFWIAGTLWFPATLAIAIVLWVNRSQKFPIFLQRCGVWLLLTYVAAATLLDLYVFPDHWRVPLAKWTIWPLW